ncbi:MAG: SIS domain-containing protein [Anaerolineaceae bacterium]|nr:SIS domain-containing protein [Anaerolineaceae bacterium]
MNEEQLKAKFPNNTLREKHPFYMGDAIYDIPGCLTACLQPELLTAMRDAMKNIQPEHIFTVGCGTSYNACQAVAYTLQTMLNIPARAYDAHDFYVDIPPHVNEKALVISISQSGQTLIASQAQQKACDLGAFTVGLSGSAQSRLAQTADYAVTDPYLIEIPFGKTRSYLSSILQGMLVGVFTAPKATQDTFIEQANEMLAALRNAMPLWEKEAKELAEKWGDLTVHYILTGFGVQKANADEVGLKIIEVIGESATSYGLEEFTHGPNAAFREDMGIFLLQTDQRTLDKATRISEGIEMSRTPLVIFTNQPQAAWAASAHIISLPDTANMQQFGVFPAATAAQFLMYYLAIAKGMNPDINGHDFRPHLGDVYEYFFPAGTH